MTKNAVLKNLLQESNEVDTSKKLVPEFAALFRWDGTQHATNYRGIPDPEALVKLMEDLILIWVELIKTQPPQTEENYQKLFKELSTHIYKLGSKAAWDWAKTHEDRPRIIV